jgi:hypothetical protein
MADFTIPSSVISGSAAADSYDLPNYVGELFSLMPQVTPFFTAIGAENGGREVDSTDFVWQVEDGEAASATKQQLENASVTGDLIIRQAVSNVVEIHQEVVDMGYTAQAVTGQLGPLAPHATLGVVLGDQPVMDPLQHQINLKIGKIKRDLEMTFLNGTYNRPTDNTTKRRTRGMVEAIATHEVDYTNDSMTTLKDSLNTLLLAMVAPTYEANSAPMIDPIIVCNPLQRIRLSDEYSNSGALAPRDRTVGGVAIDSIVTDFGTLGIMSDRYLPAGTMLVVDFSVVRPVFLPIPGKGVFFVEPLAKTGATDAVQIYGEIGLEYGPETYHGKIVLITDP